MEIWQAILTAAGTCFATLLVTYFFNMWANRPRKRQEEEARRKQELENMKKELLEKIEEVKQERIAERQACGQDHQVVLTQLSQIQSDNQLQMEGLQAVIKNDLKVRYLKWVKLGYAPMDARDDLERMYQIYHRMGRNGVLTELREQFLALPIEKAGSQSEKSVEKLMDPDEEFY